MTECRTDGTSAFNTRTVQRRLLLLDPARGKERLMEIQQHDGVVVDVAGLRQGFAELLRERERCCRGGGRRPRLRCCCPPFPPLYIGPRERGGRSLAPSSKEGCGQGGVLPPQGTSEVPSPFRTLPSFLSLAHGPLGAGALGPYRPRRTPYSPCGPPGLVDPLGGPPDPFRHSRYNTDKARNFSGDQNKTSHI